MMNPNASMDVLNLPAPAPADTPLLSPEDSPGIICRQVFNPDAEVILHDDEVTVTVDTVPGPGNPKKPVDLSDDTTPGITSDPEGEGPDDANGNPVREQRSVSLHRVIPLPVPFKKTVAG